MKKLVLLVAILFCCSSCMGEVKPDPQKFKVKVVIVYNSINLDEAAALEKQVKANHKEACNVSLELDDATPEDFTVTINTVTGWGN